VKKNFSMSYNTEAKSVLQYDSAMAFRADNVCSKVNEKEIGDYRKPQEYTARNLSYSKI